MAQEVPYDNDAEESICGAMIVFRNRREVLTQLAPDDFHRPDLGKLWGVMQELHWGGSAIDQVTVSDVYEREAWNFDVGQFIHLAAVTIGVHDEHFRIIQKHSVARKLIRICADAVSELYDRADPYEVTDRLVDTLAHLDTPVTNVQLAQVLEQVTADEDSAPWVIPGLFRRDWRVVIVGGEGHGKSVLSRQIAICASQGIHPFIQERKIPPIRVLIIDLENPLAAVAETGAPMIRQAKITAGADYDPTRVMFHSRIDGIDLRTRRDRSEIENEIAIHRPDLVILGPAYLMLPKHSHGGHHESDEESTMPVLSILNDLRKRFGFAMLIEHHAPNGSGAARDLRPMGSSVWRRWSEIGISMTKKRADQQSEVPAFYLHRYRGDRLRNDWPDKVSYGTVWPWEATYDHGVPAIGTQVDLPF